MGKDCVFYIENEIIRLRKTKKYLKERQTRLRVINRRLEKSGLIKLPSLTKFLNDFDNLVIDLDDIIEEFEKYKRNQGETYTLNHRELNKKGDYPIIWLFHGGFMGGRGVIIRPNKHNEKIYPIILEDFKKLENIKNQKRLTRNDVNPAIQRFKKLNFNQRQENHANCYNEHLKVDTKRRLKSFEERIPKIEERLASIDRDPHLKYSLEKQLETQKRYRKECLKFLGGLV